MSSILLNVYVVVFSVSEDKLRVLLTPLHLPPLSQKMGGETEGGDAWSLPGTPIQADESLDAAASHAVAPHVDRRQAYLEQLYTYGGPERGGPGGRLVSVAYFALVPAHALTPPFLSPQMPALRYAEGDPFGGRQEGGPPQGGWFPLHSLPALAEDHAEIIAYALRRLRYKLEYSAAAFQLLPEEFSLSELQHTYEIILGEKLDKRNFRRRILEAGIIEPTPHRRSGEGRPARLYRYRPDAVAEIRARRLFP